METADMVKVAVSAAPYSIDKPYSYLVPDALAAAAVPGVRVMVPFGRGNKESEGLILARVQEPKLPGSKAIRQILDPEPVLDKAGIDLALWMRGRYFCTVFEAVKTILPAGLWYGLREIWSLAMEPETARSAAVGIPGAWQVLDLLEKQGGKADIRVLRDALGDGAEKPLKAMKKVEILTCETDAKRKIADKSHRMVELAVNTEDAYALTEPKRRSAPARYEVVNFLATAGRTPAAEVSYYTGASARTLKTMEKAGLTPSRQTAVNLPSRVRMSTLYTVAQTLPAGIVINTSNLSEDWVVSCTIYGDSAGAFSPLGMYTTEEVIALGRVLGLPEKLLVKAPSDGLTGLTDEDNLGFTYHAVNEYVRKGIVDPEIKEKIDRLHKTSRFKFQLMPVYHNGLPMALTDETDYYK